MCHNEGVSLVNVYTLISQSTHRAFILKIWTNINKYTFRKYTPLLDSGICTLPSIKVPILLLMNI